MIFSDQPTPEEQELAAANRARAVRRGQQLRRRRRGLTGSVVAVLAVATVGLASSLVGRGGRTEDVVTNNPTVTATTTPPVTATTVPSTYAASADHLPPAGGEHPCTDDRPIVAKDDRFALDDASVHGNHSPARLRHRIFHVEHHH